MIVMTASGRAFDIRNPAPDLVSFDDIAHALSAQPCYSGRSAVFFSRAERALMLVERVKRPYRLRALLNEAEMAYAPDDGFASISERGAVRTAVFTAFGLRNDAATQRVIAEAESAQRAFEAKHLFEHTCRTACAVKMPGQARISFLRTLLDAYSGVSLGAGKEAKASSHHDAIGQNLAF